MRIRVKEGKEREEGAEGGRVMQQGWAGVVTARNISLGKDHVGLKGEQNKLGQVRVTRPQGKG